MTWFAFFTRFSGDKDVGQLCAGGSVDPIPRLHRATANTRSHLCCRFSRQSQGGSGCQDAKNQSSPWRVLQGPVCFIRHGFSRLEQGWHEVAIIPLNDCQFYELQSGTYFELDQSVNERWENEGLQFYRESVDTLLGAAHGEWNCDIALSLPTHKRILLPAGFRKVDAAWMEPITRVRNYGDVCRGDFGSQLPGTTRIENA